MVRADVTFIIADLMIMKVGLLLHKEMHTCLFSVSRSNVESQLWLCRQSGAKVSFLAIL